MSDDLLTRLRNLAQAKHDDLSIGDEAAAEIERLRDAINQIMTPGDNYKRLSAALATARREGMEAMAEKIAGWHETRAKEWDAQEDKFKKLKIISSFTSTNPGSDGLETARNCAQAAAFHRQRIAAIRAAAKEEKP